MLSKNRKLAPILGYHEHDMIYSQVFVFSEWKGDYYKLGRQFGV